MLDYYIGQFRLLQIQMTGPNDLSKTQLYLFKRLKKLQPNEKLTIKQIYDGIRANKKLANQSTKQVKALFDLFDSRGYGNYDSKLDTLSPC